MTTRTILLTLQSRFRLRAPALAASAIPALLLCSCGDKKADPAALVERIAVTEVSLRDVIAQTGEVQPLVKVDLMCEASGRIEKILVKEGQKVSKGDKILEIDPLRLNTQRQKLELAVEEARIRMDMSKRDYTNAQNLFSTGSIAQNKLDDLKNDLELKTISYKRQMLELDDVLEQLSKTIVKSPMNGVLTALNVEEGEIAVSATSGFQSGTVIGTIADISHLEIITQVGEVDYVKLHLGQDVAIRPAAAEGVRARGTIKFISLTAKKKNNEELGNFEVRIAVDTVVPGVVPGINVNVEFLVLERENVLGVPYYCVKGRGDRKMVEVAVRDDKGKPTIEKRPVKVGATDYKYYEILSGLSKGDTVVARPDSSETRRGDNRGPGGRR